MEKTYQLKVSEEELKALISHHTSILQSDIYNNEENANAIIDTRSQRIRDLSKRLVKADKPNGEAEEPDPVDPATPPAPAPEAVKSGW